MSPISSQKISVWLLVCHTLEDNQLTANKKRGIQTYNKELIGARTMKTGNVNRNKIVVKKQKQTKRKLIQIIILVFVLFSQAFLLDEMILSFMNFPALDLYQMDIPLNSILHILQPPHDETLFDPLVLHRNLSFLSFF